MRCDIYIYEAHFVQSALNCIKSVGVVYGERNQWSFGISGRLYHWTIERLMFAAVFAQMPMKNNNI